MCAFDELPDLGQRQLCFARIRQELKKLLSFPFARMLIPPNVPTPVKGRK